MTKHGGKSIVFQATGMFLVNAAAGAGSVVGMYLGWKAIYLLQTTERDFREFRRQKNDKS